VQEKKGINVLYMEDLKTPLRSDLFASCGAGNERNTCAMAYFPVVKTRLGWGNLFKIIGNKALVEFDYTYLVELPLEAVDLAGVDLAGVELEEAKTGENV